MARAAGAERRARVTARAVVRAAIEACARRWPAVVALLVLVFIFFLLRPGGLAPLRRRSPRPPFEGPGLSSLLNRLLRFHRPGAAAFGCARHFFEPQRAADSGNALTDSERALFDGFEGRVVEFSLEDAERCVFF